MTSRDFIYWLQGMFELTNPQELNKEQTELIKRHLALVFKHEIDPSMGSEKHQQELNAIHSAEAVSFPSFSNKPHLGPQKDANGQTIYRC